MELSARAQRVLGCLVEKALATPQQYPLSDNALRLACNQTTGRDPVVMYEDTDVREAIAELRLLQLLRTEYARGSRTPKSAHRLGEQFDLDEAQQAVLALLLLRGPQTVGELRSRADRLHAFSSLELVEAVLQSLAAHRFGAMVQLLPRRPGQKEARWTHLLGPAEAGGDGTVAGGGDRAAGVSGDGGGPATAAAAGRWRDFHDAVLAGDWDGVIDRLAPDVVFRSPAVHAPYTGREATATVLRAVAQVFEDFRYTDVLDAGDRAGLVFEARVGDRQVQGWDYLTLDEDGQVTSLTVMLRPLSGLSTVVERMGALLAGAQRTTPPV